MIHEPLDFKRAVQLLLRRKIIMLAAAALGLLGGVALAVLRPPLVSSQAWIALPTIRGGVGTQIYVAASTPVFEGALRHIHPATSVAALQGSVDVDSRTSSLLVITARGQTAARAESTANAVAQSYVRFVRAGNLPIGPVQARIFQPASTVTGTSPTSRLVGFAVVGAAVGAVIAAFGVLAFGRRDRRLWERDAIADSIGVPVLASISVEHASDAADWRKLLEGYQPGAVDAWRMRKALQYLGLTELTAIGSEGSGFTVTVLSCSFDRRALALGPQLAVFAASRGIPTALVFGPQQDVAHTATLRAACSAPLSDPASPLQVIVEDHSTGGSQPDVPLTVVVAVIDAQAPEASHLMPTTATVLGVSAGVASAEQLARIAASAAISEHEVRGIVVADPHPADTTTGRLPRVERPAQRRRPTRMTGTSMEIRE